MKISGVTIKIITVVSLFLTCFFILRQNCTFVDSFFAHHDFLSACIVHNAFAYLCGKHSFFHYHRQIRATRVREGLVVTVSAPAPDRCRV